MSGYQRKDCRLCGSAVKLALSLNPTPLANSFPSKPDSKTEKYPLELMSCVRCGHVQIGFVVDDEILYTEYKYSTPKAFIPHLLELAKKIKKEHRGARVLEIGANNGMFVKILRDRGFRVMGVDPTPGEGVEFGFFGHDWANGKEFDLILANNVFAHIDDLNYVFAGIAKCLSPDGTLIFEVQYLPRMLNSGTFDMIYHEHRDYHTIGPLIPFLAKYGLVLVSYQDVPVHGGSIRITAKRTPASPKSAPSEKLNWEAFARQIAMDKAYIKKQIGDKKVQAFGAAAKACTLIHQFEIEQNIVRCIDDTPAKQGRYIAGTDIKVVPREEMGPEPIIILAWNYAHEIASQFPDRHMITPYVGEFT